MSEAATQQPSEPTRHLLLSDEGSFMTTISNSSLYRWGGKGGGTPVCAGAPSEDSQLPSPERIVQAIREAFFTAEV